MLATLDGAPVLLAYTNAEAGSDFLSSIAQIPLGASAATGLLLLPPLE